MKAFYYELEGPGVLRTREEHIDERVGPSELVARTEFTAISPGTELAAWSGKPPLRPSSAYPRLVGYCNVARVVAVGGDANGLAAGDYVLTQQAHRSGFRCPVTDVLLHLRGVGDSDLKSLAVTYLYHLGYVALLNGQFVPGVEVAIVGLGALGYATAQLVFAFGGAPIVFTSRPEDVRNHVSGARAVLPKSTPDPEGLRALSGMVGVDIVVNTSDAWDDFLLSLNVARKGGIIVCLGFPGRGLPLASFNPLDSSFLYDKQLTIRHCGHVPAEAEPIDVRFTLKRNLRYLYGLIASGRLDPSRFVSFEAESAELGRVYRFLSSRDRGYCAILKWRD